MEDVTSGPHDKVMHLYIVFSYTDVPSHREQCQFDRQNGHSLQKHTWLHNLDHVM